MDGVWEAPRFEAERCMLAVTDAALALDAVQEVARIELYLGLGGPGVNTAATECVADVAR